MLKEKRKQLNYTQEQIAEILDISTRQLQRIEMEKALPRRELLKKIIEILKLNDEEIAKYIKEVIK